MGQSLAPHSHRQSDPEAFRRMVLEGAERLRRGDLRDLADDLHALARQAALGDGGRFNTTRLEDDGASVWL